MSVELLPTIGKKSDVNKGTDSVKDEGTKKEGGSLFDSLLKNAANGKSESKTTDVSTSKEPSTQQNKSDNTKNLENQKETISQSKSDNTKTTETSSAQKVNTANIDKSQIKQISDELVEIVVEKAKTVKNKSELLEDEKQIKQKVEELKESIKTNVGEKTDEIKKIVEGIEKSLKGEAKESTVKSSEVSKIVEGIEKSLKGEAKESAVKSTEVSKIVEGIEKSLKGEAKELEGEEVLKKVQDDSQQIKKSAQEIQKTVAILDEQNSKVSSETSDSKDLKKVESDTTQNKTTTQNIKDTVEQKTSLIVKTSDEITQELEQKVEQDTPDKKSSQVKDEVGVSKVESTNQKALKNDTEVDKQSIVLKTETIKEAVEDIEKTVSKITFVSTEEIVKSIQDLKKELEPKLNQKSEFGQATKQDSTLTLQNSSDRSFLAANGFLQEQIATKQKVSLQQIDTAKKTILEDKTLQSVAKSANLLDLNPEEVEVEAIGQKGESKSELFNKNNKQVNELLQQQKSYNRLVIDNKVDAMEEMKNDVKADSTQSTQSNQNATTSKETVVNINVPQQAVETIQNKIIGAQQKMGSLMSDVARNMYLNYKPPFTAFRMNLNPENLGSIAVMMRASKADNNITVSLNMNNASTMDAFVENKAALQSALQRQLGENSNITLNFGMENGQDTQNQDGFLDDSGQNSQNQNQSQNDSSSSEDENSEQTVKSTDYM